MASIIPDFTEKEEDPSFVDDGNFCKREEYKYIIGLYGKDGKKKVSLAFDKYSDSEYEATRFIFNQGKGGFKRTGNIWWFKGGGRLEISSVKEVKLTKKGLNVCDICYLNKCRGLEGCGHLVCEVCVASLLKDECPFCEMIIDLTPRRKSKQVERKKKFEDELKDEQLAQAIQDMEI